MRFLAPILLLGALFVPLTGPDGHVVYVNPDHVSAIHSGTGCAKDSHSTVVVDGINLCLAESASDAYRKLMDSSISTK
jgi:hypothetical protein